jgi:hypothetical protein
MIPKRLSMIEGERHGGLVPASHEGLEPGRCARRSELGELQGLEPGRAQARAELRAAAAPKSARNELCFAPQW